MVKFIESSSLVFTDLLIMSCAPYFMCVRCAKFFFFFLIISVVVGLFTWCLLNAYAIKTLNKLRIQWVSHADRRPNKKRLFLYQTFDAGQRKKNTLENQTKKCKIKIMLFVALNITIFSGFSGNLLQQLQPWHRKKRSHFNSAFHKFN